MSLPPFPLEAPALHGFQVCSGIFALGHLNNPLLPESQQPVHRHPHLRRRVGIVREKSAGGAVAALIKMAA